MYKEEDAWGILTRLPENIADGTLGVTDILTQKLGPLDSYKVKACLRCKSLCHEGFRTARRTIKQNSAWRRNSHLFKCLGMLFKKAKELEQKKSRDIRGYINGKLDCFLQLELCFLVPANIRPLHVGDVHSNLPHRTWTGVGHGSLNIGERDNHVAEARGIFRAFFLQPSEGMKARITNEGGKIGTNKAVGVARNESDLLMLEVVPGLVQVQFQDLLPTLLRWDGYNSFQPLIFELFFVRIYSFFLRISISLSNLPARLRAGSRTLGRLVVATTEIRTLESATSPSISVKRVETTRLSTSFSDYLEKR